MPSQGLMDCSEHYRRAQLPWYTICDEAECAPDAPFGVVWQRLVARGSARTLDEVKDAFLFEDPR